MTRARLSRSHTVIRSTLLAVATTAALLQPAAGSAQAIVALEADPVVENRIFEHARAIPCNLAATLILRRVIETMWSESRTFKAQCSRLRAEPSLVVELRLGNSSQLGKARARTDIVRSSGRPSRARIYIDSTFRSVRELVELIAHELEHVVEQLDDVDLTAGGQHGVYRTANGAFETARAIHIGQKVAAEVDAATNRAQRMGAW